MNNKIRRFLPAAVMLLLLTVFLSAASCFAATDISNLEIKPVATYAYTGAVQRVSKLYVRLPVGGNVTCTEGVDYTITYSTEFKNAGTYTMTVVGMAPSYSGSKKITVEMKARNISDFSLVFEDPSVSSQGVIFNGTTHRPKAVLKYGDSILQPGTEYTLSYTGGTYPGSCSVIANRMSSSKNLTGYSSAERTFTVHPVDLTTADVRISDIPDLLFTNDYQKPDITVMINGKEVLPYHASTNPNGGISFVWANNKDASTEGNPASVTIRGSKDRGYSGEIKKTFRILPLDISKATVTLSKTSWPFTGQAIAPSVTVKIGQSTVYSGTGYEVRYENNRLPGTGRVVVTGLKNLTSSVTKTFTITGIKMTNVTYERFDTTVAYSGKRYMPEPKLTYNKKELKRGTDYEITYGENKEPGKGWVKFTGLEGYTGSKTVDITVNSIPITLEMLSFKEGPLRYFSSDSYYISNSIEYPGPGISVNPEPVITYTEPVTGERKTLVKETDYVLRYFLQSELSEYGRYLLIYSGERSRYTTKPISSTKLRYNISPLDLSSPKLTYEVADQIETGQAIEPRVTVKHNGRVVLPSLQYSYADNIRVGTATITLTASSAEKNYKGTKKVTFRIRKAGTVVEKVSLDRTKATVQAGKSITLKASVEPSGAEDKSVTWSTSDSKIATVSASGKVTGKKVGSATITVRANDGGKTASCTVTVTPKPAGVSSVALNKTSAKMLANKTLTLKATVSPSDAANKAVTWKTSDKTIATVNKSGKVTGKKGGKVTITATTVDGKKTASCEIQVFNKIRVPLQDGKYYLFTSKLGNFCMTVPDKSKKAGTSLVLIKQNLSGWQKFKVKKVMKDGGEYYALINKNSGLAVTWVKNNGGDFVQKKFTGANAQLFFAMRYGDNSLQLVNKLTNKSIGIPGGKAARKANVGAVKFGAGLEQRWINAVSEK